MLTYIDKTTIERINRRDYRVTEHLKPTLIGRLLRVKPSERRYAGWGSSWINRDTSEPCVGSDMFRLFEVWQTQLWFEMEEQAKESNSKLDRLSREISESLNRL